MLRLVADGRSACTVVTPTNPDPWTTKAAQWLKEYVHKVSGVELRIASEDEAAAGNLISVGHTRLARQAGIDTDDLKWDGCKLQVKENVLYLIGRDSTREIQGRPLVGARGTARAVLTLLEDFCGVRWFLPTPEGEFVPQARNISVPQDLSKTIVPAFAYSDGRPAYSPGFLGDGGDTPASIINNFRLSLAVMTGGHTYYHAVPADRYFDEHPEYFALIGGKRIGTGNHLCSTNPEVKVLLLQWTRERLDEGIDWVSIGQEDGYLRCECPACEQMDLFRYSSSDGAWEPFQFTRLRDTPCERLFVLHKWVVDEVHKSHPDRKVHLMCYAPTAWPSKQIPHFGDNVIGELTNLEPEYIEAWKDKVGGLTGQVIWFNIQCPMGMNVHATPREVAEKIRYLHRNGFIGLAQYAETNWGLQGPVFYVLGKLMGDPTRDHRALMEEYCRGVYGEVGGTMLAFFDLLYARLEEVLPQAVEDFSGRNTKLPRWITTTEMYLMMYPPRVLNQLDGLLQTAEREADTERSRGWVRHTRDYFDFSRLLTHALISHRAFQANPSRENRLELSERVEDFDAYRIKILTYPKEYTDRWFPGHGQFCNWMTADCRKETETYYVSWDQRKPEVLRRGLKGTAMGHGDSYYYSYVKEPLTRSFEKATPAAAR